MRCVLGVDEAGRGPLAGPVAVGVVSVPEGFDVAKEFPGVADSKKLSEKKREAFFTALEAREKSGDVRFTVELGDARAIDARGIAVVVRECVSRGVNALASDAALVEVLLDGALRAPAEYRQQVIIKGDETVPLISLASIAAKVTRDRLMVALDAQYPDYGFAKHKGYGTKAHQEVVREIGLSEMHRRSFCARLVNSG